MPDITDEAIMSDTTITTRYLSEEAAAKYIGLCKRALRSLPIPVCRPNRRKLYDVRDLDSYMMGVKCPQSLGAAAKTAGTNRRSRQTFGSTAKSFLELLAAERGEKLKNGRTRSRRKCAKISPRGTTR